MKHAEATAQGEYSALNTEFCLQQAGEESWPDLEQQVVSSSESGEDGWTHLEGFVHGAAHVFVSAGVDVAEHLLQRLLPLQLLVLFLNLDLVLDLVPVNLARPAQAQSRSTSR